MENTQHLMIFIIETHTVRIYYLKNSNNVRHKPKERLD